jgi:hypothetical protein
MILKTTFYAPVIALRGINPASSTLFPAASRAPFVARRETRFVPASIGS